MKTKVIAEASSNHCGDIAIAKEMIKKAAESGADYIKFQSWQAKNLRPGDPNYQRHKKTELSDNDHYTLIDECKKYKIQFLTSCFDINRVDFLSSLGLKSIKVPSPEFASLRMIKALCERFEHLIISTGAATQAEIDDAYSIIKKTNFTFLHCVSIYPLPPEKANLERMNWLRKYTSSVGFSDHSLGSDLAKVAIAMGAEYIEKHFTIDKSLPGRDQAMSAGPDVIKEIVTYAGYVETVKGKALYKLGNEEKEFRKQYVGKWGDNR